MLFPEPCGECWSNLVRIPCCFDWGAAKKLKNAVARLYGDDGGSDVSLYAAMGMSPDEIKRRVEAEAGAVGIWPENWTSVIVFNSAMTQWRYGVNGPTGLDYAVLPLLMDWAGVDDSDRSRVFTNVRLMEMDAIELMAERRKRSQHDG